MGLGVETQLLSSGTCTSRLYWNLNDFSNRLPFFPLICRADLIAFSIALRFLDGLDHDANFEA